MKKLILIMAVLFAACGNVGAEEYSLDWYLKGTVFESIIFDDFSSYNLVKGEGPWEDNKGNFGYLNCIGKTSNINQNSVLDMVCSAHDNNGDKFWLKLDRKSERNVGVGIVKYIKGTGKFKDYNNLKCVYAVNYLNDGNQEERTGFYKQKCKVN